MTEATFWLFISLLNWNMLGDDDAVVEPLVADLAQKTHEEIRAFEDILASKLHQLDTEAHAREIGDGAYGAGYFSVDWFLYARCAVVASGRATYETVRNNPSAFPRDREFEALLNVASDAYERKTGETFDYTPRVSYETFSNRAGWP